jgi:hypothetical protein
MEAQYWNGSIWARNTFDSCTFVERANFAFGNYAGALAADPAKLPTANLPLTTTFASGAASLLVTKPIGGLQGAAQLALNLGAGGNANACTGATAFTPAATGANRAYLQSPQTCVAGYTGDPSSTVTFGIYRNRFIYRREVY